MSDAAACDNCGAHHPFNALDAKPHLTLWLRIVRLFIGPKRLLSYAAAHGYDFDRLECAACYGPGYEAAP